MISLRTSQNQFFCINQYARNGYISGDTFEQMKCTHAVHVLSVWMVAVLSFCCIAQRSYDSPFFRVGPSPSLTALGYFVDTPPKFMALILFCVCNSFLRTLHSEVTGPWLINNVQSGYEVRVTASQAYHVTAVHCVYTWFDWYISISILLSQIDIFAVELACNVAASLVITRAYIRHPTSLTQV